MNRRTFLKITPAASAALYLNGHPVKALAENPLLQLMAKQTQANGRVFVLVQLLGGNDGLNTLIPLDQYSGLSAARSNILIPAGQVLPLSGTPATGLHPAMTGMRNLYNNGKISIIQGVSYPDPNFSHFRATDIWTSGSSSTQFLNSGWLGRYLDQQYPGYPAAYPNSVMSDPLAIHIGSAISPVFQGPTVNMGMALTDVTNFYNIVNGTVDPAPNTPAGHELNFIRQIEQQTQQYTSSIQQAALAAPSNMAAYPANNLLAEQLKIVARLIKGGLDTPLYIVSMGSFDTHSGQTVLGNNATGVHANLLSTLSGAISAFQSDLELMQIDDRVAGMTFSEFGRRIVSNASGGTDHGTAAPVFVFSSKVIPGIIGSNPVIPATVTAADNLPMQHDFRSIYASVLRDWFGISQAEMQQILYQNFNILPIFDTGSPRPQSFEQEPIHFTTAERDAIKIYPNPVRSDVTFEFDHAGGELTIGLFDMQGRFVGELYHNVLPEGRQLVHLQRNGHAAGQYVYKLTCNGRNPITGKLLMMD